MNTATDRTMLLTDDAQAQAARLRQVLRWIVAVGFSATPLEIGLGLLVQSPPIVLAGAIGAGIGIVALLALALLRRGRLRAAVLLIAAALLVIVVILTTTIPALSAASAIIPLMTIALLLPYLPSRTMLALSAIALVVGVTTFLLAGLLPPLLAPPAPGAALIVGAIAVGATSMVTLLLLWQFSAQLLTTIAQTRAANIALEQARATLETTVTERTADLRTALADLQTRSTAQERLLNENSQQRAAIRAMSVPVLPVSIGSIVIPLIGELDSERLHIVQEQTLRAIERSAAHYVLLDITGVAVVDTQVAKGLLNVVQAARLLGAEVVLVGIRPEVAQTVVALGLDLHGLPAHQSLREGIAYTLQRERGGL